MSATTEHGHNQPFTLRPLGHALGAELIGIDPTTTPSPAVVEAVAAAWQAHHLLLIRGHRLNADALVAFAGCFGALDQHDATPFYRLESHPEILQITNREIDGKPSETRNTGRNWHSDYSYTGRPAAASTAWTRSTTSRSPPGSASATPRKWRRFAR